VEAKAEAERVDALTWDAAELLEINDGVCPECGGLVAEGRDTVAGAEVDIVFCPNCHWVMTVEDLQVRLADAAEAEEYNQTMDALFGFTEGEEEDVPEGVTL
jgi:hypothetical protein